MSASRIMAATRVEIFVHEVQFDLRARFWLVVQSLAAPDVTDHHETMRAQSWMVAKSLHTIGEAVGKDGNKENCFCFSNGPLDDLIEDLWIDPYFWKIDRVVLI